MSFSHLDPGTDEVVWAEEFARRDLATLDLTMDALVVVAAHPDDETLAIGGLLHRATGRGIPVTVIVATDGENSHPATATAGLGERRRRELRSAMRALAPHAVLRFLRIPDGAVAEFRDVLGRALAEELRTLRGRAARPLVLAPWQGDRHRDHRVAGEVAQEESRAAGVAALAYPLWLWHWGAAGDVPWHAVRTVALSGVDLAVKRRAIAAHASQIAPLSAEPGGEVMLHARMLSHFDRSLEVLIDEGDVIVAEDATGSIEADWFAGFYERHADPWGFDSRWYEARKRDALMASLPEARYAHALELGCATGALTARLAERCDRVTAVDVADEALTRARIRLADAGNVELRRAELPGDWPDGTYDLIVFSEIGYYWDAPDLEDAITRMRASLAPGGHLVACHWRHPVPVHRTTGDGVHVALRTIVGLDTLVRHEEADFLLEVFAEGPALSVAAREGLTP